MDQSAQVFLEAKHLSKEVQSGDSQISILRDVNLTLQKSESVAILGASGSGKTTFLTLLAGLDLPTAGRIVLDGQVLSDMDEESRAVLRGRKVGFIFQNFQLLPSLNALENVMLPLELQYVDHNTAKNRAENWLTRMGLKDRLHHFPKQLSGGEQQRVAIARAFVTNPEIIFADEMTGNLDTKTGKDIADMVLTLNREEKTTFVIVTHDREISKQCHRQLLLKEGLLTPC